MFVHARQRLRSCMTTCHLVRVNDWFENLSRSDFLSSLATIEHKTPLWPWRRNMAYFCMLFFRACSWSMKYAGVFSEVADVDVNINLPFLAFQCFGASFVTSVSLSRLSKGCHVE